MAMDHEKSFWLSYSDLMTSLFFIMLVLFVTAVSYAKKEDNAKLKQQIEKLEKDNKELSKELVSKKQLEKENEVLEKKLGEIRVEKEQYENMLHLEEQFKQLSKSTTLRYDEEHRTFVAKDFEGIEIFKSESEEIQPKYIETVDKVGRDLEKLLKQLYEQNPNNNYLLVIEGNAANTYRHSMPKDKPYTYRLSYGRALALYNRWNKIGIDLRQYNTEIQICGSGLNGINRDNKVEENNKRFVIQIIPKISRPKQMNTEQGVRSTAEMY